MRQFMANRSIHWMGFLGVFLSASFAYSATITVNQGESIQSAIESAQVGDTIVISAGTYQEDLNIGDVNTPGNTKDNLTLKAAEGATVEIKLPNEKSRLQALAALGADFGTYDRMGFVVNSNGAVIEGLKFVQISTEANAFDISCMVTVVSSNVTFRNCEFVGMGLTADNDVVGMAITPIDAVSISAGAGGLATNLTVENCKFHDLKYPFGNANFLVDLGLAVPSPSSLLKNCEFYNNDTCINMDNGLSTVEDCNFHDNLVAIDASDDGSTITNCVIMNNTEDAIVISNSENESDEPEGNPIVTIDGCTILYNGSGDDHNGINIEQGTLTVKNTIIGGSTGANIFFRTETGRITNATIDHCDLYNSAIGSGIATPVDAKDVVKVSITNSIIVDAYGIVNDAGALADIKLDYCNVFASLAQFYPDQEFITATNLLNTDPGYTDAENGDFTLQTGSTMATAGKDGTYLGSQGLQTAIRNWMIR